jgi:hypothetical protein
MNVHTKYFNSGVPTKFSTHTSCRNSKNVLENCITIYNLSLRIGDRGVLKWIIKKQEFGEGGGGYTAFI